MTIRAKVVMFGIKLMKCRFGLTYLYDLVKDLKV
jgi:hypothetical protein